MKTLQFFRLPIMMTTSLLLLYQTTFAQETPCYRDSTYTATAYEPWEEEWDSLWGEIGCSSVSDQRYRLFDANLFEAYLESFANQEDSIKGVRIYLTMPDYDPQDTCQDKAPDLALVFLNDTCEEMLYKDDSLLVASYASSSYYTEYRAATTVKNEVENYLDFLDNHLAADSFELVYAYSFTRATFQQLIDSQESELQVNYIVQQLDTARTGNGTAIDLLLQIDATHAANFANPCPPICGGSSIMDQTKWDELVQMEQQAVSVHAYPNPFSHSATIEFSLAYATNVRLEVFNIAGQPVARLFDGYVEKGMAGKFHFSGEHLPPGIYLYQLTTDSEHRTGKLHLVR